MVPCLQPFRSRTPPSRGFSCGRGRWGWETEGVRRWVVRTAVGSSETCIRTWCEREVPCQGEGSFNCESSIFPAPENLNLAQRTLESDTLSLNRWRGFEEGSGYPRGWVFVMKKVLRGSISSTMEPTCFSLPSPPFLLPPPHLFIRQDLAM